MGALSNSEVARYHKLARTTALAAGDFLRDTCERGVESNEGHDIKLAVDRFSEDIIIEQLAPVGLSILSEERGLIDAASVSLGLPEWAALAAGTFWIVDPLDGSMNFSRDLRDLCCVAISLWDEGKPVLGVVNRFQTGEVFESSCDTPALLNGVPIVPSEVTVAEQAVLATGLPSKSSHSAAVLECFGRRMAGFKKIRALGSAALMASFVACGRVDVYLEDGIMLWDVAAAFALVTAAGGAVELTVGDDLRCQARAFASSALRDDCFTKGLLGGGVPC